MESIKSSKIGEILPRFEVICSAILQWGCSLLLTVIGMKKCAQLSAHSVHFRAEKSHFDEIHPSLKSLKILFLTDAHIGGSIDSQSTKISENILQSLESQSPDTAIILHGGDFVCSGPGGEETALDVYSRVANELFAGLSPYRHFGVIGNHDAENSHFPRIREHLEEQVGVEFLVTPDDVQYVDIGESKLALHGIHTLSYELHKMSEVDRETLMDDYILALNAPKIAMNIVLIHNPDGLEFLLRRLIETETALMHPTLFLAGHTHGGMLDIPIIRRISLLACHTKYARYKGWYAPTGKYASTGNWKLYVSTGMGNSQGSDYRINADPEVVMLSL